jgi:catechol 2,3-dioxygenase-like lactoylglutathione lyase family enzyme
MIKPGASVRIVVAGALLAAAPGCATSTTGTASGNFTGEVKPVLYVRDVEESARFFEEVLGFALLGFSPAEGDPYYADMGAGPMKFGLHEPIDGAHEEKVGRQRIYFRVRDLAAQRARVQAGGGTAGEVRERAWMDFFVVRDPDGHDIVFAVTDPARHTIDPW